MRLGLKLAAIGLILLTPKTHLYVSNQSDTQAVSERPISGPAAPSDHPGYVAVAAEGRQPQSSTCAARPGDEGKDALAIHAMDKSLTGSHG
jgi:hypothetical protein